MKTIGVFLQQCPAICANLCQNLSMAGQIIKRDVRTWTLRVFQGRDAFGKRRYFNKTVHGTKKEAQAMLNSMLSERDLGTLRKPTDQTLSDHSANWLEAVAKGRVRQRTLQDYRDICARYVIPKLGGIQLTKLTPATVQAHYARLSESGLSARTVRHVHAVLNNSLESAVRWKMITQNPCSHVDLPRVARTEVRVLTAIQAQELFRATEADPLHALFVLLISTGMRPSEALALRWSDVDLEMGRITVQRAVSGRAGNRHFEEPKTPRSRRTIPLPRTVTQLLVSRRDAICGSGLTTCELVFPNGRGETLDLNNIVKRHFKPALRRAGLPDSLRLYDLRHSCATMLLQAGVNPKIVSERLGHASVTLTLDTYSHVLPDMQESAAEKLETALFE